MKIIQRNGYLKKIEPYIDKNIIKVLTGQRRVGKSYMMRHLMNKIQDSNRQSNIIFINKEQLAFDDIRDYKDLYKYVIDHTKTECKNVVMIDEIQEIVSFERALRDLNENPLYDIFCTGSNAVILSGELSTFLAGRYIEIQIHSLSFEEFILFHKMEYSKKALNKYIQFGGMPYLIHLKLENEIVFDYLKSIYNSIILKDIVSRHNIRNVNFLDRLVLFLADNTGSPLSAKNISDFLKSQRVKLSINTVMRYLNYLQNSFCINKVSRCDVVGKKIFEINEKYYFEDIGMRNSIISFKQRDIEKILENIIYNHLKFRGYTVYVGKYNNLEIDFMAEKSGQIIYVQVAYLLKDPKTIDREFGNLLKIKDNYRKIVVSMDEYAQGNIKGVEHLNIIDFFRI